MKKNLYEELGLKKNATRSEIKSTYPCVYLSNSDSASLTCEKQ